MPIESNPNPLSIGTLDVPFELSVRSKITRTDWLLMVLALLFVVRFAWLATA